MYSPRIVERNVAALESRLDLRLVRYPLAHLVEWEEHLATLYDATTEAPKRPLTSEEQHYIRNERLLSMLDFRHWLNYCFIIADPDLGMGVGLQRMIPTQGQERLLAHIAKEEERQTDAASRGETVEGILTAVTKTRQHGITMLARALTFHRLTTTQHIRAIGGSVDDDKTQKLFERDKRILDNLPWWLRPHAGYEEKALHIVFDKLDSSLLYQTLVQKAGIGQGEQYDIGHFTEVSSVPYFAITLENDYQPTIPRVVGSLHILETTPFGRDNWWRFFVEDIRKGGERWKLCVLPWYAGLAKYRKTPPEDWKPSELALLHAQRIYETSLEYIGERLMLPKENLYWWETTRDVAQRQGALQWFYTNYWATIEESFQHTTSSIFDQELISYYQTNATLPVAYELCVGGEQNGK